MTSWPSSVHLLAAALVAVAAVFPDTGLTCTRKCGNIDLPYPFGLADEPVGCYFSKEFQLVCNLSSNPPALFFTPDGPVTTNRTLFAGADLHISQISLETGELTMNMKLSYNCYQDGINLKYFGNHIAISEAAPFAVSNEKNVFTAVGCDTAGYLRGWAAGRSFISGCLSYCGEDFYEDGKCNGVGCCQLTIPQGMKQFSIEFSTVARYTNTKRSYSCGYAFVADKANYTFNQRHIREGGNLWDSQNTTRPFILEWAIPKASCTSTDKICGGNTTCDNFYNNSAIRCFCIQGYEGNPYYPSSCIDIDECQRNKTICSGDKNKPICKNKTGSYTCEKDLRMVEMVFAIGGAVAVLFLAYGQLYKRYIRGKQRSLPKGRLYARNGGFLLRRLARSDPQLQRFRFLTEKQVMGAITNFAGKTNFSTKNLILTINPNVQKYFEGSLYIGKLLNEDSNTVELIAIKEVDARVKKNSSDLVDKIVALYKKGRTNMVQLLGGCFETTNPLLIYQLNPRKGRSLTDVDEEVEAPDPVVFAAETANVLENYMPSSVAVPLTTLVQWTLNYCKHFKTVSQQSERFCFGLVLVKLLTGKRPVIDYKRKGTSCSWGAVGDHEYLVEKCRDLLDEFTASKVETVDQGVINLVELIKRCLNKNSPESMDDILSDLKKIHTNNEIIYTT